MVVFLHRCSDEQCCQHREQVSLQECNQQFQHRDEQGHRYGKEAPCSTFVNENDRDQSKHDNVSCCHVRKQTNHQCERLREDTYDLDRDHNDQQRNRNSRRREDVTPVVLVSGEYCKQQCKDRENECHT